MVGWLGRNQPGPLEQLSGIWVGQANAWRSLPHEWQSGDWGPLDFREWGTPLAGEVHIAYQGRTAIVKPGEWYTFPPGMRVRGMVPRGSIYVFLWLAGFQEEIYARHCGWSEYEPYVGLCPTEQAETALRMAKALHFSEPGAASLVQAELWRFLSHAQAHRPSLSASYSPEIARVLAYIDANPGGERRNVAELAGLACLGSVTFRRRFAREVGLPVMRYWLGRRLQQARQLLVGTRLGVAEVATAVGFDDAQHFSRLFAGHTGSSPSAFRAEMRRRPAMPELRESTPTEEELAILREGS